MPVHPQAQAVLDAGRDAPVPQTIEEAREQYDATALRFAGAPEPVARASDEDADGVRVRVYVPEAGSPGEPLPAILWIHGGGWIVGTLDAYDPLCRALCNASRAIVCSVDYRLAPEHRHPAPLTDCERALEWLLRSAAELGADPARVALGGDSAGGNLAAVLARRHRERLCFQLLVYPVTDAGCSTRSYEAWGGEEYGLSREKMAVCWAAYAAEEDTLDPDVSPLRADDLAGLPPALVICAEYDPLTDEGLAYADRLREAGVPVRVSVHGGMVHGFFRWRGAVDAAHEALREAASTLREAFALAPQK